jgi:glycerophosphoryl diester phosphodiesterase
MLRQLRTTRGGEPSVLAHRGGVGPWRENTIEAFAGARAQGADGVELDARLTGDGQVVVHHDASVSVGESSVVILEAGRKDLPDWVPGIEEVVAGCSGLLLDVEIKLDLPADGKRVDSGVCRALTSGLAETLSRSHDVIVSSFWPDALTSFSELAPGIATGLLVHPGFDASGFVSVAANLGCSSLLPHFSGVDQELVERCHAVGLEVGTWTVNQPADVRGVLSAGVDAVVTDQVGVAIDVLRT